MFGDNKYVVDSDIHPHYKLQKRHTTSPFHLVRESIASKIGAFCHVSGGDNPADII